LLRSVPIDKVKEFEADFLETMEMSYRPVLDELKNAKTTPENEGTIRKLTAETAEK